MSTAHDDLLYLEDIQKAIETILGHVQGIEEEQFKEQQMHKDAVVRQLEIIGESHKATFPMASGKPILRSPGRR